MCTFVKQVQDGTVGPSGGWGEGVVPSPGSEGTDLPEVSQLWGIGGFSVETTSTYKISLCLLLSVPWGQTPVQQSQQWLGNKI